MTGIPEGPKLEKGYILCVGKVERKRASGKSG
jgi:hypothetical protein